MDRKLCVLVFSQYSPASKRLFDSIAALPFDLPRLIGLTLLQADSDDVRERLKEQKIDAVPALVVQYFDGSTRIFFNEDIYDFFSAVGGEVGRAAKAMTSQRRARETADRPPTTTAASPLMDPESPIIEQNTRAIRTGKVDVMEAALAMQKARDDEEHAEDERRKGGGQIVPLPSSRPSAPTKRKTKLL